ncbi:TonB-dependent receptor [Desulfobulbus rhabdoformis]|uniref:TonB-dependent receptor domain-containing protein n=1 Tax=Desulfobulbus rhabdoformis TaxID=34032 RepID=UPI00196394FD|nr:TonB-dependent receptor [Desulfobulbus rhabdoformis]
MCALVVLSLLASSASAEEKSEVNQAEDIVVTATRTETNVDDAPASVTVISREDIEKFEVDSLVDTLKHVTGLYVNTSSTGSVSMRGLKGDSRTLIMVNGTPVNDGYSGGGGWNTMGIDNVERIEVIRGSGGSALYGGYAMGGVINIITSKPTKREGSISAGFGSDNTYKYSASAGDRYGRFGVRIGYESTTTDGYPENLVARSVGAGTGTLSGGYGVTHRSGAAYWVTGDKGDVAKDSSNLNLMASYDLTDTGSVTLDFQRGTSEKSYGSPHTYLTDSSGNPAYSGAVQIGTGDRATVTPYYYISGASPYSMENYLTTLTYKEIFGPVAFTAKGGFRSTDTWYTSPTTYTGNYSSSAGKKTDYGTEAWTADLQGDISLGQDHLLTLGASFKADSAHLDSYNLAFYRNEKSILGKVDNTEGKTRTFGFFVQDEWTLNPQMHLFAGLRLDTWTAYDGISGPVGSQVSFDDHDDSSVSPHLALVWNPLMDTYVRASVGHAFRPPTVYDLYRVSTMGSTTYHNNPELGPETSWNYEVGADQYFFDRKVKCSVTGFFIQAEDFISSYRIGSDSYKENVGEAEIRGLEFALSAQPLSWLDLWANYTITDSEVKENSREASLIGKELTDYPEQMINIGAGVTYKQVKASVVGNYTGRMYYSDMNDDLEGTYYGYANHWLWDAKMTYTPLEYADISFSINNMFDEEYFTGSMSAPGRTYFVELKLKF